MKKAQVERKRAAKKLRAFCEKQHNCGRCPFADIYSPDVVVCQLRSVSSDDTNGLQITAFKDEVTMDTIEHLLSRIDIYSDQTAKADAGKLPMDLVPVQIMRDIAEVRRYGNEKYGDPNNWRRVKLRQYVAALIRHGLLYLDYLNGDDDGFDDESHIEHYKHMACNMAFICEMEKWKKEAADEKGA